MRQFIPFAIPSGSSPAVQTQTKSATITTNGGSVTVEPDSGFLLSSAAVTADIPTEEKTLSVTENGNYTITPTAGKLMTKATVSVSVPTGGGLEEGMVAVHDIPNGKILSAHTVLSASTADNAITATITLPGSLSGKLPDYIIIVSDKHTKSNMNQSFKYGAKVDNVYNKVFGGMWYSGNAKTWNNLTVAPAAPTASVDGATLTMKAGTVNNYRFPAGTLTFYAIYTGDDTT